MMERLLVNSKSCLEYDELCENEVNANDTHVLQDLLVCYHLFADISKRGG